MRSEGKGYAEFHCRYHVQFKARHGSHWYPSYKATELRPYVDAAKRWVTEHLDDRDVVASLGRLEALLNNGGEATPAFRLKGRSSHDRARVAFARLREAGIPAARILAIHLGMLALIEEDRGSHRVEEFRIVQVAKALHRLASGTHSEWKKNYEGRNPLGFKFDFYPNSSGIVLRKIGHDVQRACEFVTDAAMPEVLDLKRKLHGPHSSHLPGWKPLWQRQREAALAKA